jgi:GNAT superfamily N-acetyltransferase
MTSVFGSIGSIKHAVDDRVESKTVREALASWRLLPFARYGLQTNVVVQHFIDSLDPKNATFTSTDNNGTWLAAVRKLDWDTEFFGFGIGKIEPIICPLTNTSQADMILPGLQVLDACLDHAKNLKLSHLSTQVHPTDSLTHTCLERKGFLLRDTIVCYELKLTASPQVELAPNVRLAEPADARELASIADQCLGNRSYSTNRFNSDPQFSPIAVREFYKTWIIKSLSGHLADKVFVCCDENRPVGFITVCLPSKTGMGESLKLGKIPLNGVHPQYHRRGIYRRLVSAALSWLASEGAQLVEIRTQLSSAGVNRTWQSLGATAANTFHTFHANLTGP